MERVRTHEANGSAKRQLLYSHHRLLHGERHPMAIKRNLQGLEHHMVLCRFHLSAGCRSRAVLLPMGRNAEACHTTLLQLLLVCYFLHCAHAFVTAAVMGSPKAFPPTIPIGVGIGILHLFSILFGTVRHGPTADIAIRLSVHEGGYIRRFHEEARLRLSHIAVISMLILLLMYGVTLTKNLSFNGRAFQVYAMAYHGLVLPFSVAIFLLFKNLTISSRRIRSTIYALAPLCFSVYIIHTQSVVHEYLWTYASNMFASSQSLAIPLLAFCLCVAVFFVCCAIDSLRLQVILFIKRIFCR